MAVDLATEKISIEKSFLQGDTISPKLFTLALQGIFKNMNWFQKGININGKFSSHLHFDDDIVLMRFYIEY